MKKKLAEIGKKKTSPSASTSERKAMIPCTVPGCDAMVSSKKGLMAHLKSSKHVPLEDRSHCEVCKEDVNLKPKESQVIYGGQPQRAHEEAQADSRKRHSPARHSSQQGHD